MLVLTPEIATIIASSTAALLALVIKKARCFARRMNGRWSYGVGFTEAKIIPEFEQDIHIQLGGRQPIVSGVSSDSTSSASSWRRALSPLTDGLASRKLTSGK